MKFKILIVFVVVLSVISFGLGELHIDVSFNSQLCGSVESEGFLAVLSGITPYTGKAEILSENGTVKDYDGMVDYGLALFKFVPDENATQVSLKIKVDKTEKEFFFFSTPARFLNAKEWYLEIIGFEGSVGIKRKGSAFVEPVALGQKVYPGDEIHTMEKSYVELKGPNDMSFYVAPNSVVKLEDFKKKDSDVLLRIKVMRGDILTKILQKLSSSSLVVIEGGGVPAGVRGTIFSVGYNENDGLKVRTFQGSVVVNALGERVFVKQNKMLSLSKDLIEYIRERKISMERLRKEIAEVMKKGVGVVMKRMKIMEMYMNLRFEMRAKKAMKRINECLENIDVTLEEYENRFFKFRNKMRDSKDWLKSPKSGDNNTNGK